MGYKLGYHILVLPNQVLLINSVLTSEVLLYLTIQQPLKSDIGAHGVLDCRGPVQ